jgi:dihydrofolate reductase
LFGSPGLVVSLLERGLFDELRVMVNPVLRGGWPSLFIGIKDRLLLRLLRMTHFSCGNVLLTYQPVTS